MTTRRFTVGRFLAFWLAGVVATVAFGQVNDEDQHLETTSPRSTWRGNEVAKEASPGRPTRASAAAKPQRPEHADLLKDSRRVVGAIPLYQKENHLYAELDAEHYDNEFIVLISIARGIGREPLYGGMSWKGLVNDEDDWVWVFRKINDRVHVVRKNVRFRADEGSPEATAVKFAYTDSVLFSLPVAARGPTGGDLVDLAPVFMSDLPHISRVLKGFVFSAAKSTWASAKGFKDNVELEVQATYESNGRLQLDSVADSRGVTVNVHYSISRLPRTGYQPRLADDRVGFFLTALKDYSSTNGRDRFLRYINRWDVRKADPSSKLSPPKEPIIFWLEKTVPFKYRKVIRDGILEWNKAFELAGFVNAVEVRQQPDDAEWEPEDVNYNTFRWITSSAGLALGPSRVNPYSGQILDADILFDADFLQFWKTEYETFTPRSISEMTGGPVDLDTYRRECNADGAAGSALLHQCQRQQSMARQFAFGLTALSRIVPGRPSHDELQEKMVLQGIKSTVMHELGHTLGLRHNFKGSTRLSLDELNNSESTRRRGMLSSVMDYDAVNIVTGDMAQGDFFTATIGPYDVWAIQYGYTPLAGESPEKLAEIASRSGEPQLAYATDEDARGIDPDPLANRYDLGKDPIEFARRQAKLVQELLPGVADRMTEEGDDYVQARRAFNVLLATHGQAMNLVARYVGGLYVSRSHKGDKDAPAPITVVEPEKQREALRLLAAQVFSDEPFQVAPELYNHLGPSNWRHWGMAPTERADFPVHQVVSLWQSRIMDRLLSSLVLERIHDTELKIPADQDAFTTAELIERLTRAVFSEVDTTAPGEFSNRQPAISSLRRNLQREYFKRVARLAMGHTPAPQDCQMIAFYELAALQTRIDRLRTSGVVLDTYSQAHLDGISQRIDKVLEAQLSLRSP